ncbi:unnamed protein product, partial [Closterium sp. NIES-53]
MSPLPGRAPPFASPSPIRPGLSHPSLRSPTPSTPPFGTNGRSAAPTRHSIRVSLPHPSPPRLSHPSHAPKATGAPRPHLRPPVVPPSPLRSRLPLTPIPPRLSHPSLAFRPCLRLFRRLKSRPLPVSLTPPLIQKQQAFRGYFSALPARLSPSPLPCSLPEPTIHKGRVKEAHSSIRPLQLAPPFASHPAISSRSLSTFPCSPHASAFAPNQCTTRDVLKKYVAAPGGYSSPLPFASLTPRVLLRLSLRLPCPQNQRTTRDVLKKYIAASGGYNSHMAQQGSVISGHVTIWASEVVMGDKTVYAAPIAGGRGGADVAKGTFRVVQMPPNMWHVAVAMGDTRIDATCDGELVWRRSSWGPSTTAKGPVRPLRHLLAGLDPPTVADVFASGEYQGDEGIEGDECMCVKVMANPLALMSMSTGGGNVGGKQQDVCDVLAYQVEGFFSKASGLLIGLRDHHLTKTK